jgi:hypothetical protein
MPMNTTYLNAIGDAGRALITHVSLHTADPGSGGANEVSGGSPAYARKGITWNAASGGNIDSSNTPVFDVPAGTTITHAGFWSAASGGTFYGSSPLTVPETFGGQGTYTMDDADISHSAST